MTGNHYPYLGRERARSSLGFVVNITAPETTCYLRLKTNTASQLTVEALEPAEAERKDDRFDLMAVFFTTAMLLLLLWAIHSYVLDRLPVVGLFAMHQAVYTLYGVAVTGYLAPFLPRQNCGFYPGWSCKALPNLPDGLIPACAGPGAAPDEQTYLALLKISPCFSIHWLKHTSCGALPGSHLTAQIWSRTVISPLQLLYPMPR